MNNFDTVIKAIKQLEEHPNIDELTEEEEGLKTICSTSPSFINQVDDDLVDQLIEIEHSAAYYLFDEGGIVKKDAIKKLQKSGLDLVRLNGNFAPFSHGLKTSKFHILVSP